MEGVLPVGKLPVMAGSHGSMPYYPDSMSSNAVSQDAIDLIVSMGFSKEESTLALQRSGGDPDLAIDMLARGIGETVITRFVRG